MRFLYFFVIHSRWTESLNEPISFFSLLIFSINISPECECVSVWRLIYNRIYVIFQYACVCVLHRFNQFTEWGNSIFLFYFFWSSIEAPGQRNHTYNDTVVECVRVNHEEVHICAAVSMSMLWSSYNILPLNWMPPKQFIL